MRWVFRWAWVGSLLSLATTSAFAQTTPAFGDQFAILGGIQLGTLNLSELVKRYGAADIVASGEGDDYQAAICYRLSGGLLYLMSNNLGGSEHRLLGYKVVASSPGAHCAPVTRTTPPVLDAAGLRLGISSGDYERLMHSPRVGMLEPRRVPVAAPSAQPRAADENIFFFRNVSVEGTFANGLLVGFEVWLTAG